ncbi:hypothetical protein LguiB_006166 [Lonicera macranthoides]
MFIGDGAKLVKDTFKLAKEKSPYIIFIGEIDAIGTNQFDSPADYGLFVLQCSGKCGDTEVQRTMLELLNLLDGFSSDDRIDTIFSLSIHSIRFATFYKHLFACLVSLIISRFIENVGRQSP